MIQLNTITKNTSLLENDVAFLQKYHIGKAITKLTPAICNKYILPNSRKSINPGKSKKIDKNIDNIDKNLNVGLKLIILIEISYSLH